MALVLTRMVGEIIFVGPDVVIRVASIRGKQVALAIEAPKDVPIKRSELVPPTDPRWENVTKQ